MKPGRPLKQFEQDPDRHLAALALAYEAMGTSRRGGCEIAIASAEGLPVADNTARDHGGHGLILLDWVYQLKPKPGGAATIAGRARGLRHKLKAWLKDAAKARRLYQLSNCWLFAIQPAAEPDPMRAKSQLLAMAQMIGETEFGDKLVPLVQLTRSKLRQPAAFSHPNHDDRDQG